MSMEFSFSQEQEDLRQTVSRFLAEKAAEPETRRLMESESGFDKRVWEQMGAQMGLQGIVIPELYGGAGYGLVELGVVMEEMGRSLLCAPFLSTVVLAAQALLISGDKKIMARYLPAIAAGEITATLALPEDSGEWGPKAVSVREATGELSGTVEFVIDGHTADLILVPALGETGLGLHLVEARSSGMTVKQLTTIDQTRKAATVSFERTPAARLELELSGEATMNHIRAFAAIALAAEQVGGAQRALEMSVKYASDREQFGHKIGSYQAIKHRCAEMFLEVESARSAAYFAAYEADESDDAEKVSLVASFAKALCSDAFMHVAAENIQIHGGIGFTWDYSAQLYYKRAKSAEIFLGDATYHRALMATQLCPS